MSLRIALFTDSYLPTVDGVVTSVLATRRELEAHGHRVFTFAPEDPNNGHHVERDTIFVKAKEFRPYPGYRLAIFPGHEIEALNDLDVDLIHSHGIGFMGIKGLWCSWASRIPIVQTYHTLVQEAIPFYSPLGLNLHLLERGLRLYLRVFLNHCEGVVVPTRSILGEVQTLAPRARIRGVIPTGIDPQKFHPGLNGYSVRSHWGLNGHDVVLHVGRVSPEKNLATLINAFPYVKLENPDAKLLVVGSGPYMDRYYDLVRKRELLGDVIFTGFVPDAELPKYYAACDTFAIASKFETQGLVVLEALSSGKPVAGANSRAIPEFVEHGRNGYLFNPDSPREAARAVLMSLEHRDEMKDAARETALAFSVDACTRRLETVYDGIVAS